MIPTLILAGLVIGRWWALPAAAVLWPAVLVWGGVMGFQAGLLAAAGLAVINTLAGVLVHKAVVWTTRRVRGSRPSSPQTG